MAKNSAASLLTSVDSLFTTQEERDIATQPRVQEIPIDKIDDCPRWNRSSIYIWTESLYSLIMWKFI